jgi:3-dehydroquinate synthase
LVRGRHGSDASLRRNIFITGFSGSGKTTVGRMVARNLGWSFFDLDEEIVRASARTIEEVFAQDGEPAFRDLEHGHLAALCKDEEQVVSTGGGIVTAERNRSLMGDSGLVVCLEAMPDVLYRRLMDQRDAGGPIVRPMLADPDPLGRIVSLKVSRQPDYARADWTVNTDRLDPEQVAAEVVRAWGMLGKEAPRAALSAYDDLSAVVRTAAGDYPVWTGWGILDGIGERARRTVSPGAAYVVSDEGAYPHARRAQMSLEAVGIASHLFVLPPGEQSKTLESAGHLYDWLAGLRAERSHLLVAVGGGMVGDLAGFVAATYVRGMRFAQVPTTVLAMMDSAIGGKTAVDLPQGKNLVGAFHQPSFVLEDVEVLRTLPRREAASGWAEAIKHGLILDEGLVRLLDEQVGRILDLDEEVATEAIRRSAAVKADVVSRDEKETLGVRVLLNYGHTIGHAIEAATDYGSYLHGEAVGVGMMGAAFIAADLGMLSSGDVARQRSVLQRHGLPTAVEGVDPTAVRAAMGMDKKTSDGIIRWVLLERIGQAATRNDVPAELVDAALRSVCR